VVCTTGTRGEPRRRCTTGRKLGSSAPGQCGSCTPRLPVPPVGRAVRAFPSELAAGRVAASGATTFAGWATPRSRKLRSHRRGDAWSSSRWLVGCTICTRGAPPEPSCRLRLRGARTGAQVRPLSPSGESERPSCSVGSPSRGVGEPSGLRSRHRLGWDDVSGNDSPGAT
jgi:hypothetical protein